MNQFFLCGCSMDGGQRTLTPIRYSDIRDRLLYCDALRGVIFHLSIYHTCDLTSSRPYQSRNNGTGGVNRTPTAIRERCFTLTKRFSSGMLDLTFGFCERS